MNKNLTTGIISVTGSHTQDQKLIDNMIEILISKLQNSGEFVDFTLLELSDFQKRIYFKLLDHQELITINESLENVNGWKTLNVDPEDNQTVLVASDTCVRILFDMTTKDFENQKTWFTQALKGRGSETYEVKRTCR